MAHGTEHADGGQPQAAPRARPMTPSPAAARAALHGRAGR